MVTFTITQLPNGLAAVSPYPKISPTLPISLDPGKIAIPEDLGKIQEAFDGNVDKVVVLVQDAHAIPDAQRSIRKAILYFYKKYGVQLIALEGASSALDPRILKSFPDKDLLNKVMGEYFDRGELAGGTAAAIAGIREEDNSAKSAEEALLFTFRTGGEYHLLIRKSRG